MSDNPLTKQITSLLLGGAVGDAPCVPVEFRPRNNFHVTGMRGGGTHNRPPGAWPDNTSFTLCLADSLARGFSLDDIARNFVGWRDEAAFIARGGVFDIGISTAKAIRNLKARAAPENAGCHGINENGNGSLMRVAPLVFYIADKPEMAFRAADFTSICVAAQSMAEKRNLRYLPVCSTA